MLGGMENWIKVDFDGGKECLDSSSCERDS